MGEYSNGLDKLNLNHAEENKDWAKTHAEENKDGAKFPAKENIDLNKDTAEEYNDATKEAAEENNALGQEAAEENIDLDEWPGWGLPQRPIPGRRAASPGAPPGPVQPPPHCLQC